MTPIPWVTRRETEVPAPGSAGYPSRFVQGYDPISGREAVLLEVQGAERDSSGFLWIPDIWDQTGKPQWKEVHPRRQRMCMDEGICQVCGQHSDELLWVINPAEIGQAPSGATAVTYTPPVCPPCEPIARKFCPKLRSVDWRTYQVRKVLRWGVLGDVYQYPHLDQFFESVVRRHEPDMFATLARQRVVRLTGMEEVIRL